jgi:putative endopeptidase
MNSKLFWLAGTALIAGCTTTEEPAPAPVAAAEAAPPPAAPAPKPEIGEFGFDETGMDKSVLPGNSFYKFANGTW